MAGLTGVSALLLAGRWHLQGRSQSFINGFGPFSRIFFLLFPLMLLFDATLFHHLYLHFFFPYLKSLRPPILH